MVYVQGSCYGGLSGGYIPERILMHEPKGHRGRPCAAFQLPDARALVIWRSGPFAFSKVGLFQNRYKPGSNDIMPVCDIYAASPDWMKFILAMGFYLGHGLIHFIQLCLSGK